MSCTVRFWAAIQLGCRAAPNSDLLHSRRVFLKLRGCIDLGWRTAATLDRGGGRCVDTRMKAKTELAPGPGIQVLAAEKQDAGWMVSAVFPGSGRCPMCDLESTSRHGWYVRHLQDLPIQGSTVVLNLRVTRWQCRNPHCGQQTFVTRLPEIAPPFARRTRRVIDLALLLAHAAGGRPAERLMRRLGVPKSDDTLLRSLKRHVADRRGAASVRVLGIDDWSWRKGSSYGTIMVELERREVLDGGVSPNRRKFRRPPTFQFSMVGTGCEVGLEAASDLDRGSPTCRIST
jgi:hypothetical protein